MISCWCDTVAPSGFRTPSEEMQQAGRANRKWMDGIPLGTTISFHNKTVDRQTTISTTSKLTPDHVIRQDHKRITLQPSLRLIRGCTAPCCLAAGLLISPSLSVLGDGMRAKYKVGNTSIIQNRSMKAGRSKDSHHARRSPLTFCQASRSAECVSQLRA